MPYTLSEITERIKNPKNKKLIKYGQECYAKNMLHLRGVGIKDAVSQIPHFENPEVFSVRNKYSISNVDLFNRLLQEEEQVYTTIGGGITIGGLPETPDIGKYTSNAANGMPLRKWMQRVAYDAYNADNMGILFVEHDGIKTTVTYKCITGIQDYDNRGRELKYVCFKIGKDEYKEYNFGGLMIDLQTECQYFRWVDEDQDIIVKYENGTAILVDNEYVQPLGNVFGRVPGFIISDIVDFTDSNKFMPRLYPIIELADCFLKDRSIAELQKAYHGFAKAVEPFLQCDTCHGDGVSGGLPCPKCTQPGQEVGSGYKTKTKVSDVSRFPIEMLKDVNFDFRKIFGYVTPDISSMEYQNKALFALEALMYRTHWGSVSPAKIEFNGTQDVADTATKIIEDKQPKRAVLNTVADWSETAESMLLSYIVQFYTGVIPSSVCVSYNRDYVLNTPEELLDVTHIMKKNSDPPNIITAIVMQYIRAAYKNNPNKQQIETKKYLAFPLPNDSISSIEASPFVSERDKIACRYYPQWMNTITDAQWLNEDIATLRENLYEYCNKNVTLPPPQKPEQNG